MMFEIGKEYQNRKGVYEVLSIHGSTLRVRYQDGSEDTLDAVVQERIISNMDRDNKLSHLGGASRTSLNPKTHTTTQAPERIPERYPRFFYWPFLEPLRAMEQGYL